MGPETMNPAAPSGAPIMIPSEPTTPSMYWEEPVRQEDLPWLLQLEWQQSLLLLYAVIVIFGAFLGFVIKRGGFLQRTLGALIGFGLAHVVIATLGLGAFVIAAIGVGRAASKPQHYWSGAPSYRY